MKIFCFYGIEVPTERSYYYAVMDENPEQVCDDSNNTAECTTKQNAEPSSKSATESNTAPLPVRTPELVQKKKAFENLKKHDLLIPIYVAH